MFGGIFAILWFFVLHKNSGGSSETAQPAVGAQANVSPNPVAAPAAAAAHFLEVAKLGYLHLRQSLSN